MFAFGRRLISAGRICALVVLAVWLATAAPRPHTHRSVAAATTADAEPVEPVELVVANRPITTLRAMAFGASPADRVEAITDGLAVLLERGGPLVVSTQPIPEGVAIQVDGKFVFRILDGDANREAGETTALAADAAMRNLQQALNEMRESRDSEAMLRAIGYTLLATLVLAGLLWAIIARLRLSRAAHPRLRAAAFRKTRAELEPSGRGPFRHRRPGGRAGEARRLGCRAAARL